MKYKFHKQKNINFQQKTEKQKSTKKKNWKFARK